MSLDTTLCPTPFFDYDSPIVQSFLERTLSGMETAPTDEKAVRLYYKIRDEIFYEIYSADFSPEGMRASSVIEAGKGLCIHKSIVYVAAARAIGIPARLVLTDARNHLTSDRLRKYIGGDVFHFHCLASIHLNDTWVRCTPVFNKRLCQLYNMRPLEFDGHNDSLHHPYDEDGNLYMEFVREHGEFDEFPYDMVVAGLRAAHPNLFADDHRLRAGSLENEAPALS